MNESSKETLRENVMKAVVEYCRVAHPGTPEFQPGDRINYAGRVFNENEVCSLVDSALDFWLTAGRFSDQFERRLAEYLNVNRCFLVNSGSSANLLAFMALASPELGDRAIRRGDEVITVAAAFPTTVSPIVQFGAVPVFVDVEVPSYNIDCEQLEAAISDKTKAVMLAHTMGNPFDLAKVKQFCDKHGLWLIEDNCDSLGGLYGIDGVWKQVGTIGDIGTSSFYPAHHMTLGEGGAVYTNDPKLGQIILSLRDWGRDCWCPPGCDNTCGCRFTQQLGELPQGYDHKYVYSRFGYNLKATDMQAAIGCAQLDKLPAFVKKRQRNWKLFRDELETLAEFFILPEPQPNSIPSWFGFLLTVRESAPFTRLELTKHLESRNIQTRTLFSGNLLKQPCFDEMKRLGSGFRVVGDLTNTDRIMNQTFWFGVYPGIDDVRSDFIIQTVRDFCRKGR